MMWEWIFHECVGILKKYTLAAEDKDDIIQETMIYLFSCPETAQEIYNNYSSNGLSLLKKIVNHAVLERNAYAFFDDKRDYSIYKKVLRICEKYSIHPIPENAYKIAPLMGELNCNYTIVAIENLLNSVKPTFVSLDALVQNGIKNYL